MLVCSGTPTHLNRFFEDVDLVYTVAGGAAPTDEERIRQCKYYLDYDTHAIWESVSPQGAVPAPTWEQFKNTIRGLYPGCDGTRLFAVRDLERFVTESALRGVYTWGDLGQYYREFMRMASHLRVQNRISEGELDRLYIQGFRPITRGKIEQRLLIKHPDDHPDDVQSMARIQEAANFLLSNTSPDMPGTNRESADPAPPSSGWPTATTYRRMALTPPPFGTAPQSGQVQVKRETFDMDIFMAGIGKVIADNTANRHKFYSPENSLKFIV